MHTPSSQHRAPAGLGPEPTPHLGQQPHSSWECPQTQPPSNQPHWEAQNTLPSSLLHTSLVLCPQESQLVAMIITSLKCGISGAASQGKPQSSSRGMGRSPWGAVSGPETALQPKRPFLRGGIEPVESPGPRSAPQPDVSWRWRIRTNFMLVLAGALHSGQLVLNCSTWRGERAARVSQAAQGSCPGCPPALQCHPPRPSGPRQCRVVHPAPLPARQGLTGPCSLLWGVPEPGLLPHLQPQQGTLLWAPPVVSDCQGLVPLWCPRVLHKTVPRGVIEDLGDRGG